MPKISLQKGERLIAEIRANRLLYDSTKVEYTDLALKTKVWNLVAAKCGLKSGHEAKLMWKILRDSFRICRGKNKGNPPARVWRFYKHMEFIAPYIKHRKSLQRSASKESSLMSASEEKDEKPPMNVPLEINDNGDAFTTVFFWDDNEKNEQITNTDESALNEPEIDSRRPEPEPETELEARLQSPFDTGSYDGTLHGELPKIVDDNSLKMFFDAMYASTSEMPLSLQRTVKRKIFAAVMEAEEEAHVHVKTEAP